MRRVLVVTAVLATVSLVAAPVSAGKGNGKGPPSSSSTTSSTTEPTAPADLVDCLFDAAGVLVYGDDPQHLQVWTGEEPLFCEYVVSEAELPALFRFKIEAIPGLGNRAFTGGYLSFKEEHPGSDFCYREYYDGRQDGATGVAFPIPGGEYAAQHDGYVVLPAMQPDGEQCETSGSADLDGPEVFTLSVHVTRTQGGPVRLRMTEAVFAGGGA